MKGISKYVFLFLISGLFYNSSCNRQTNSKEEPNNMIREIIPEITTEEPFKNQPNELCTIIRKLNSEIYAPEEQTTLPPKYCLLDICLENNANSNGVINIGDSTEQVNTYFQLIKIFNTEEEMLNYVSEHGIKDVVY